MLALSRLPRSLGRRRLCAAPWAVDSPYSGEIYAEVPEVSAEAAMAALARADAAQKEWARTSLPQRVAVCERAADYLTANAADVAADITGQMGKPLAQARGEIGTAVARAEALVGLAPEALADEVLPPPDGADGALVRRITKEPVGTVLCIAPWNYPVLAAVNAVFPAVLAGNAVLVKHSPRTPLCALHFAEAFKAAGAPEHLVAPLACSHEAVAEVMRDPRVGFVAFTGSVRGGREVHRALAEATFTDCTLELGGKDAAYVAADADPAAAAAALVDGACYNAGQSCCGIERVYVARALYPAFLEAAQAAMEAYELGDPMAEGTTMGPLALPGAVPFLEAQVADARAKGARVLCGGHGAHDAAGRGRFFVPALVADCTHEMDVMREESFGPVMAVAPVDDDDEAVELINDSAYGLTAAVFTQSEARANRLAPRLQVGTVFLNRCDFLDPLLPWSGRKDTGKGVSLSRHGFGGVVHLKAHNFRVL